MKQYIPYITSAIAGLFFIPLLMAVKGYEYAVNGHDILNAVLCMLIVYWAKSVLKYSHD